MREGDPHRTPLSSSPWQKCASTSLLGTPAASFRHGCSARFCALATQTAFFRHHRSRSVLAAEPPKRPDNLLDELADAGPAVIKPFSLESAISVVFTVLAFVAIQKLGGAAAGIFTPELSAEQVQAFGQ